MIIQETEIEMKMKDLQGNLETMIKVKVLVELVLVRMSNKRNKIQDLQDKHLPKTILDFPSDRIIPHKPLLLLIKILVHQGRNTQELVAEMIGNLHQLLLQDLLPLQTLRVNKVEIGLLERMMTLLALVALEAIIKASQQVEHQPHLMTIGEETTGEEEEVKVATVVEEAQAGTVVVVHVAEETVDLVALRKEEPQLDSRQRSEISLLTHMI